MAAVSQNTKTYDNLIVAGYPITNRDMTLLSGEVVTRGQVLGKVTASGKLRAYNTANSDGSETPYAVAADDTDATGGDTVIAPYIQAHVSQDALIFAATDDYDTAAEILAVNDALQGRGIFVVKTLSAQNE